MDIGRELAKAFDYGYEQGMKDATQWISVEDTLPRWRVNVLTVNEKGECEVLHYDRLVWCYPNGVVKEIEFHITHWMPLPEPPKGE